MHGSNQRTRAAQVTCIRDVGIHLPASHMVSLLFNTSEQNVDLRLAYGRDW